jgi:hypothetical protein
MATDPKRTATDDYAPNTTQLRGAMPSGRIPTKTSAFDPSAAPFDTDDEAAGHPAPTRAVERAMAEEVANQPTSARERDDAKGVAAWLIAVPALLALLAAVWWLA